MPQQEGQCHNRKGDALRGGRLGCHDWKGVAMREAGCHEGRGDDMREGAMSQRKGHHFHEGRRWHEGRAML